MDDVEAEQLAQYVKEALRTGDTDLAQRLQAAIQDPSAQAGGGPEMEPMAEMGDAPPEGLDFDPRLQQYFDSAEAGPGDPRVSPPYPAADAYRTRMPGFKETDGLNLNDRRTMSNRYNTMRMSNGAPRLGGYPGMRNKEY